VCGDFFKKSPHTHGFSEPELVSEKLSMNHEGKTSFLTRGPLRAMMIGLTKIFSKNTELSRKLMQNKPLKSVQLPRPPALPKKYLGRSLPQGQLASFGRYSQLSLSHEQYSSQIAEHVSFEQMLLKQVSMHGSELTHAQVRDSRWIESDLANANWVQADFARVELLNCRLTGFHAIEARLQDVLFKDCQASLAQFRFATFKTARFEHCDFSDADFQGADLSGAAFVDCNLSGAEMSDVKLAGADLRGCTLDGLHVGLHELQGAIIDPSQALALVQAFGIVIEWPETGTPDQVAQPIKPS
jgi:uncharacterized protein YjbI with pentapeptide repeats